MSVAPSLSDHTAPTVLASRLQTESCTCRVGCPALSAEGRRANAAGSVSEVSSTASLRTASQKAASHSAGQPSWVGLGLELGLGIGVGAGLDIGTGLGRGQG